MQFDSEFFSHNRHKVLELIGEGVGVITANGLLQRSADTTFPFRQDSNFWYLTGIEQPDFILVLSAKETFIIMPPRQEHRDIMDGSIAVNDLKRISGIESFYDHIEGWNRLDRILKKSKKAYTITPFEPYIEHFGFYANPARGSLLTSLKKHRSLELVDIRKDLARLRQVKQPVEIKAIKEAINITGKALAKVRRKLETYQYEYEMVADITAEFIRRGAMGHAYSPIVAADLNAATIHYVEARGRVEPHSLILFDVGAEVNNYSADISRTYAVGRATKRQKDIYKAVQDVQAYALSQLRPGVTVRSYEALVDAYMAEKLKGLDVIDDVTDKKRLKKYYPHLTSHFLGLDVHDSADYERPLEPGMIVTVEPGIYIPAESIGIRIEDDVLITSTGTEVLSKGIDSSLMLQ